jgi:hypothetical protein
VGHHEPSDWVPDPLRKLEPSNSPENELPIEPPHDPKSMERELQEGPDFDPFRGPLRTSKEASNLRPDLLEIARRPLGCPQTGAFEVEDLVALGQPTRDVVAGRPILRGPVVAEVEEGELFRDRRPL